jgi:hypothetical protein
MVRTSSRLYALTKAMPSVWIALALVGCGGSSGPEIASAPGTGTVVCNPADAATFSECGTLLVGITDAEGDIVSYSIDVLSLTIERADGLTIETLPATTRVDFAELTDLSELVSAATLPPGIFVGGTITVDYATAEIFVEAGGAIVPAEIVDADGIPLGVVELRVGLSSDGHIAITRGRTAFLSIDFDLSASHVVDTSVSPPRITAEPIVAAEVRPVTEKDVRVRGGLVDVDVAAQSYEIRLQPWHRRVGDHGPVIVHTTDSTSFEIGETTLIGDAGLEAMAALEPGALTAAFGTLDLDERSFTASIVLARDSVDGNGIDAVRGNIVARSGDLLTVKGAWAAHHNDRPRFRRTVFVEVGPNTRVFKVTDPGGTLSEDDLSVGQRIVALGEFRDMPDSLETAPDVAPILDATDGRVRMNVTHLSGEVTDLMPGQLTMKLRAIDRLGVEMYDFSGTGMTAGLDADPNAYEVATGTLALDALAVDRPVRVLGFVTPFGLAPPDFEGRTLVGHRDIPSLIGITWQPPGTVSPFLSMGPDGLVPNLDPSEIGTRHHILIGRELVDLLDLPAAPAIEPSSLRAWYSLQEPGHIEMFAEWGEFVAALGARLANAETVRALAARGHYDDVDNALTSRNVVISLLPATQ